MDEEGVVSEAVQAAALTSTNPVTRIMARGAASSWMEELAAWVDAEVKRPKANTVDVLQACWALQLQTFASLAALMIPAAGDSKLVVMMTDMLKEEVPRHMAIVRRELNR